MTASVSSSDLLRRLLDDHLPAHIQLPADFLIWTQATEQPAPFMFPVAQGSAAAEHQHQPD